MPIQCKAYKCNQYGQNGTVIVDPEMTGGAPYNAIDRLFVLVPIGTMSCTVKIKHRVQRNYISNVDNLKFNPYTFSGANIPNHILKYVKYWFQKETYNPDSAPSDAAAFYRRPDKIWTGASKPNWPTGERSKHFKNLTTGGAYKAPNENFQAGGTAQGASEVDDKIIKAIIQHVYKGKNTPIDPAPEAFGIYHNDFNDVKWQGTENNGTLKSYIEARMLPGLKQWGSTMRVICNAVIAASVSNPDGGFMNLNGLTGADIQGDNVVLDAAPDFKQILGPAGQESDFVGEVKTIEKHVEIFLRVKVTCCKKDKESFLFKPTGGTGGGPNFTTESAFYYHVEFDDQNDLYYSITNYNQLLSQEERDNEAKYFDYLRTKHLDNIFKPSMQQQMALAYEMRNSIANFSGPNKDVYRSGRETIISNARRAADVQNSILGHEVVVAWERHVLWNPNGSSTTSYDARSAVALIYDTDWGIFNEGGPGIYNARCVFNIKGIVTSAYQMYVLYDFWQQMRARRREAEENAARARTAASSIIVQEKVSGPTDIRPGAIPVPGASQTPGVRPATASDPAKAADQTDVQTHINQSTQILQESEVSANFTAANLADVKTNINDDKTNIQQDASSASTDVSSPGFGTLNTSNQNLMGSPQAIASAAQQNIVQQSEAPNGQGSGTIVSSTVDFNGQFGSTAPRDTAAMEAGLKSATSYVNPDVVQQILQDGKDPADFVITPPAISIKTEADTDPATDGGGTKEIKSTIETQEAVSNEGTIIL